MSLRHKALPPDDFGPVLPGPAFGGLPHVMKVLHQLGCFQHQETCPKCNSTCSLRTEKRVKKLKNRDEKEYSEVSLSCTFRRCKARLSFVNNTIWKKMKDRLLFVFIVNAFLNRSSTQSVVNETGCKPTTAEKYMKIIKNALFLENDWKEEI